MTGEFVMTRPIKATRKPCACLWCGEPIPEGSAAMYMAARWDDPVFGRMHPECGQAWSDDCDDVWDVGGMVRGRYVHQGDE